MKQIIVGLRAFPPSHLLSDCLPGYLRVATAEHRHGFQLKGLSDFWLAWTTNPYSAINFEVGQPVFNLPDSDAVIAALVDQYADRYGPFTVLDVYG